MFQNISYPKIGRIMKKILMSLVLVAGMFSAAWAQPTFTIGDATVNTGDQACITVAVKNFTDIMSMDLTFEWDPTQLAAGAPIAQNFNASLTGLGLPNFSSTSDSTLLLSWEVADCAVTPNAPGITVPDGEILFDLCFTTLAGYGEASQVCIANDPAPVVFRTNSNCLNIGLINECGIIYTGVEPFILTGSDQSGNMGDLVCVDFTVSGFNDLQSTQFDIIWDPAVLECVNQIPGNVPNLSISNFNCLGGDRMRISWASLPDQGVTVDNGTLFFTACFNLLAPCESFTALDLDLSSLIEITNTTSPDEGFSIPYEYNTGSVSTGDCDPIGLQLFANCGDPVNINEQVCVEVTVGDNFNSITDMNFLMEWNEQILTFDQIQNFHPNVANLENEISYNPANGFINVDWEAPPPASIANGEVLFDVCFTVTGLGGNSPFTFAQFPANVQVSNGPNIGINPINCQIEVIQPEGVAMSLGNGSSAIGEELCIDINVANFDSITSYQFSLSWDPILFQYNSSSIVDFPGATDANINDAGSTSGGLFFFDFNGTSPITLADATTIIQICFEPLSTPGTCTALELITVPLAPEAISAASNGENIGIIDVTGELCTLFPEGFGIYIEPTNGLWLESICVPVTVESFDNITDALLSLNWDPTVLDFAGINNTNAWPGLIVGDNLNVTGPGLLTIDWTSIPPVEIPDETVVFEICFDLIGDAPTCTPISVSQIPEPVISTSNGQGSLTFEDGEVCIEDQYIITDLVILPTTCPDACDGEITFSVIGGTAPLGTTWEQNGQPQFQPFHATNLCAGDTVYVTVFDDSSPILLQEFTFVVPLDTLNVPTADGGPDATINCNTNLALLVGTSGSADHDPVWTDPNGFPSEGNTYFASSTGIYIYSVENLNTGCTATDTVLVFPGVSPLSFAGDDVSYTCLSDTVMLDGTGSAVGDTINYSWEALLGGEIVTGQENLINPQVTSPGIYVLTVTNSVILCSSTDTVEVIDDQILPEAIINNGAETATLTCETDIILSASTQNNPPLIVEYEWFDLTNTSISNNSSIGVSNLGTYILITNNTLTGCMASDTIEVIPNEDFPVITMIPAGDTSLTCIVDTIQFAASIDGIQENLIFNWSTTNGQFITDTDTTLTPSIISEGLYILEVTDTTTNCTALAQIIVTLDTIAPIADAGLDLTLTCTVASDTLIGTNSSTGDNIVYIWTNEAGDTISMEPFAIVDEAGTYCLEVLNTDSGCSSVDCADVTVDAELPVISSANFIQSLTCVNDTLVLQPDMITSPNTPYAVVWFPATDIIGPTNLDSAIVDQPGIYQIRVIDPVTGCVGVGDFVIDEDITPPTADAGMDATIDCNNESVTIGSDNSSIGDDFTYLWVNTVDGETPNPDNTIMTDVMTPGTYELTITNVINGCTATDDVVVGENLVTPVVVITDPETITCTEPCVSLTATAGGLTDITVVWTGLDGGAADPVDALVTSVCVAGNYEISVTNNENGCITLDTVLVEEDLSVPVISIATPADFTCADESIQIDASATGAESDFSTIEWTGPGTITPATGSFIVSVDMPGDYELQVINVSNGCEATQVVTVVSDMVAPIADAGEDDALFCGDVGVLDGFGSSQGDDFEYLWTAIEGVILEDPATVLDPMVEGAGIYELLVTDISNGCTSTDTVEFTFTFPADAMTMIDTIHCSDSINIIANLPNGTTGLWTTPTGAIITDPTSEMSLAHQLQSGDNIFIWTLSAELCENYSADTLIVSSEVNPIANNDLIELTEEIRNGSVNIAANDILSSGDYTLTILTEPAFGQMDSLINDTYYYSVGPGAGGEVEVDYEICSTRCPEKCDQGTIIIIVPEDPNEPEIPNTITPNDDGMNDVLIFDIIANNSIDEFPDNELIVFNRWGDIVYQVAPYYNDWGGLNEEGKELPHGTYYYILRLNISKGEIIRGDITIIK
jgi:gliding motility-associated-like protein